MKKTIYFFFALFISSTAVLAQTMPEIKIKHYTNEDGKLYWNKSLPIYIKLSTTPEGEGVNLKNKVSENYDNPFFLDTEGANYIRTRWAVDNTTKKYVVPQQELLWEVFADSRAPRTKITYSNTKKHVSSGVTQYAGNLSITLSAADQLSGTEDIYICIGNSTSFQKYTEPINFTTEGEHFLKYFSVDNVGNLEKTKTVKFFIDLTSPETALRFESEQINSENIFSSSTKMYLDAKDGVAGIRYTYYSIDKGKKTLYTGKNLPIYYLKDGNHTINYYSVDYLGNTEQEKKFDFYLDKKAPTLSSNYLGDKYETGNKIFFSKNTKLELTADDNKSGIKEIKYILNNEPEKTYTNAFLLPEKSGWHTIKYYAVDNLNNTSRVSANTKYKTKRIYVDITKPKVFNSIIGDQFKARDTLFVSTRTKFKLSATDSESGIKLISYNSNQQEITYSDPFVLNSTNKGLHKIEFTAFDNVGNSQNSSFEVYLDNAGPNIEYKFSVISKSKNGEIDIYPYNSSIFLTVQDDLTGIKEIYYSINSQTEKIYQKNITGFLKGEKNIIKIRAIDKLNNETLFEIVFFGE